jgi:hypothetical protein
MEPRGAPASYFENHDWDLTRHAAGELLAYGRQLDKLPTTGTLSKGFSCFAGSMLLSFSSIESFSSSVAFVVDRDPRYPEFDFNEYKRTKNFWDKIAMLARAIQLPVDRSQGIFQKIAEMQAWRNLVTHASPYSLDKTQLRKIVGRKLPLSESKQYPNITDLKNATEFYATACTYIDMVEEKADVEPYTGSSYVVGED